MLITIVESEIATLVEGGGDMGATPGVQLAQPVWTPPLELGPPIQGRWDSVPKGLTWLYAKREPPYVGVIKPKLPMFWSTHMRRKSVTMLSLL